MIALIIISCVLVFITYLCSYAVHYMFIEDMNDWVETEDYVFLYVILSVFVICIIGVIAIYSKKTEIHFLGLPSLYSLLLLAQSFSRPFGLSFLKHIAVYLPFSIICGLFFL